MSKFTILPLCLVTLLLCTKSFPDQNDGVPSFESPLLVKRDQRTPIVATEFGEISAIQIGDGYHIQFITLEPNALLLPLLLHSDMVFFVHTGSGILNWVDEEKERTLQLRRGDVFRLRSGTVFYVHSNLESDQIPEKLRVYAIFNVGKCLHDPCLGAYSNIRDLLLGFSEKTLRSAFAVPEELLGKLRDATKPPLITNALPRNRTQGLEEETWTSRLVKLFVRVEDVTDHLEMKRVVNSKNKKSTAYNVFEADPDFENVNGQSIVVDEKDMDALKGSSVGVYMVNLTKGSIMGPHWNPNACEISIVLRGEGMVRVVNHPSSQCKSKSESERFMVEEGDVFIVPQFYPMAQMSFVNSSFMFMGFSTSAKTNHPQFLVGQSSVLKVLDREVLATYFNVRDETIERLLGSQKEAVMLECVSCAEVELSRLMREIEERKRREEEEIEQRRKEEEEERRRREEEEEARKIEEERKKEEEAAKRREEERRKREEEETERKRKEEEEARKREEQRKREEAAAKRREEERRKREEEEEEARKREEAREREEEKAKRQEEERKRREKEEEEARKREEAREREEEQVKRQEEERKRREKEEEEARKREEAREREEEQAKRQEEERMRREKEKEAARKREEERKQEEEMAKIREEERQRKEREEAETKRREEQERKRREEEAVRREREEEAAKRAEEERRRRREEEEEEERRPPPQPQRPIDH